MPTSIGGPATPARQQDGDRLGGHARGPSTRWTPMIAVAACNRGAVATLVSNVLVRTDRNRTDHIQNKGSQSMSLNSKGGLAHTFRATAFSAAVALLGLGSATSAVAQDLTPSVSGWTGCPAATMRRCSWRWSAAISRMRAWTCRWKMAPGSNPALVAVSSGNNDIVLAGTTALIQGIPTGLDVIAIGGLVQVSPDSIVSLASAPISKPEDLIGKTIAGNTNSASAKVFEAFMRATGIDASQVTVLNVAPGGNAPAVLSGAADGMTGWAFTDAVGLGTQAEIAPPMLLADYGIRSLGMGFVTSTTYAEENPEVVKKFMAAVTRGYDEGFADPEAAIDALVKARPLTERELQLTSLNLMPQFARTPYSKDKPFGWTAIEDWESTVQLLRDFFEFTAEIDIPSIYTNEFVVAE